MSTAPSRLWGHTRVIDLAVYGTIVVTSVLVVYDGWANLRLLEAVAIILGPVVAMIRPDGSHVIFDYEDFSGFGTNAPTDGREAFLDAGTIASQANQTYELSGFVNPAHPLPPGCNIKIKGIAPGAEQDRAGLVRPMRSCRGVTTESTPAVQTTMMVGSARVAGRTSDGVQTARRDRSRSV